MEVVLGVVAKIATLLVEPIGQWLCYSFEYDSNIETLENRVQSLKDTEEIVQHDVASARRNGKEIEPCVTRWLTEAGKTIEEANKLLRVEERAQTRCSNGACLNLILRHQLSQKATKIVQDIGEFLEAYGRFQSAYRPTPQWTSRSTDYVDCNSRKLIVAELMEALSNDNINLIGVWGMAGVGKSTLVSEVADHVMKNKLFHEVAIANVTQSPNTRRIQGELADMLGLKFNAEELAGRADELRQRLTGTKEKKILVILDDIWKNLDLKDIGIPAEGCKVLLTSRDRDVLVSGMCTGKDVRLKVLDEEEAWSLFEKMAGDFVDKEPNLRCVAKKVAEACAGLPLALVTVSKALKNKELFEWRDALKLLKRPAPEPLEGMQSTIYSSIKLSYVHLERKDAKDVFLRCAEHDYNIHKQDLLKYCYGLGVFHGITRMEDARDRLYTILRILKDCCLLLQSPYSSKVLRMHDVVRDAAQLIAWDHNMLIARADGELKEWSNADALKRCKALSVHNVQN